MKKKVFVGYTLFPENSLDWANSKAGEVLDVNYIVFKNKHCPDCKKIRITVEEIK